MKNSFKMKTLKTLSNKMKTLKYLYISLLAITAIACKKEDEETAPSNDNDNAGSVNIMVQNAMNDGNNEMSDLLLYKQYTNVNGDFLTFSKFKYYISNLQLINEEGDTIDIEESYHLIEVDSTSASKTISLSNIPSGNYSGAIYSIGIDSEANLDESIVEGDLDPSSDMTWNWQVGYKFFNMEGTYSTDETTDGAFIYHLGKNENYRTLFLDFPKSLVISDDQTSPAMIHIMADINKLFGEVNVIDADVYNTVKVGPADQVADMVENYEQGFFSVHHIDN